MNFKKARSRMGSVVITAIIILAVCFSSCKKTGLTILKQKPNIIFIMTDDMGYETVSYNKALNYHTPNIDQLAKEGYVFTNCDSQPLCCPTRTKLVTGQYNYRNYTGWGSFNLELPAIGAMMQQAGYSTGVFGKWHLNKRPEELGFDEYCLFSGGPVVYPETNKRIPYHEFFKRYYYDCPLWEDGKEVSTSYSPDKFNERVLKFIDDHKQSPFFIYYPLALAHSPFVRPTPDSNNPDCEDWQENFEDMVAYADKMIGKVVEKLKKEGLYENTVIFYTSDNGTKTLAHHLDNGETTYGEKHTQTVDGVHVPLFIKYDGKHKTFDDLVDFCDFYPTIASIAGVTKDQLSNRLDGVSLHPLLEGHAREPKPFLFSAFFGKYSTAYIRDKQYKYYWDGRLFDIGNDPGELIPFYTQNDTPETTVARKRLKGELVKLIEGEELSGYPNKQKIIKDIGDVGQDRDNNWMIGNYLFDQLEYIPRTETIRCDITKFLDKNPREYNLRVSRVHLTQISSGQTYADAKIKSVQVFEGDETVQTVDCDSVELTTRIDVEALRDLTKRAGNPHIAFKWSGDNSEIPLGKLNRHATQLVELQLQVELANPENQWGDRIRLYLYLDRKEK